jgi:hypothetical protein
MTSWIFVLLLPPVSERAVLTSLPYVTIAA